MNKNEKAELAAALSVIDIDYNTHKLNSAEKTHALYLIAGAITGTIIQNEKNTVDEVLNRIPNNIGALRQAIHRMIEDDND